MIQEIKTFLIKCDVCEGNQIIMHGLTARLPPGWVTREIGPCGMTNYYKTQWVCGICHLELEKKQYDRQN